MSPYMCATEGAALTVKDLEGMSCACEHPVGGCEKEPMYFHSQCHLKSPVRAVYFAGHLMMTCAECGKAVADVKVAAS